jgi:hypothetical protein
MGRKKLVVIDTGLSADEKQRIVAMLDKACPAEMALMRAEAARNNFEYLQARTEYALAKVRADWAVRNECQ